MTRKKRARRDARLAHRQPPVPGTPHSPESSGVEVLVTPHPGPATLASGWKLAWRVLMRTLRSPLALMPLMLATLTVFVSIKMALVQALAGMAAWSTPELSQPDFAHAMQWLLWYAAGYLVAPWALAPWLAAYVHRANGIGASWRLVFQPFRSRWGQLLVLGVVWVAFAVAILGLAPRLRPDWGPAPAVALLLIGWLLAQIVLGMATAMVWRDEASAWRALRQAPARIVRSGKPLLAAMVAWAIQAFVLLSMIGLVGPWVLSRALGHPAGALAASLVLLAILAWLLSLWYHQLAALVLALLDWSRPSRAAPAPPKL